MSSKGVDNLFDPAGCDPELLGELHPRRLLLAYAQGVFPMVEQGRLAWFSPDPRGLLPLDDRLHLSRRLRRTLRQGRMVCTVNRRFREVVHACADRPEGTWISPEIAVAYERLHRLGAACSVETWPRDRVGAGPPIGGLYGVAIGGGFFAESMFHRRTDAGKVALAELAGRLRARDFTLCDVQWTTPHLRRFGAFDVPRDTYLALLAAAIGSGARFA